MIAVASKGNTKDSEISDRAARAPYILFFDDGELVEAYRNPYSEGGGGAGFAMGNLIADKKAERFIAARIGENLKVVLEKREVEAKVMSGKVKDVLG
ncbi:MAG: NifB/NifX family molybdenum-iron cluster-binding protein [Nanobdellota archaeon]